MILALHEDNAENHIDRARKQSAEKVRINKSNRYGRSLDIEPTDMGINDDLLKSNDLSVIGKRRPKYVILTEPKDQVLPDVYSAPNITTTGVQLLNKEDIVHHEDGTFYYKETKYDEKCIPYLNVGGNAPDLENCRLYFRAVHGNTMKWEICDDDKVYDSDKGVCSDDAQCKIYKHCEGMHRSIWADKP